MPIQLFPFNGGIQGGMDTRLLPDGALSDAINCQLDRDGRLVGRAGFTALATTVYGSGAFVGYDLFSVGERLFAFGDRNGKGYATDIFEYVTGSAAVWVPSNLTSAVHRLPRATALREVGRAPDPSGGVSNFSVAATAGFALLALNNDDPDGSDNGYLHLFKPDGDQTLLFDEVPGGVVFSLVVVALSDRFHILSLNAATTTLLIRRLIPTSDETSQSINTTAYTGLGAISVYDACKVAGSDQTVIAANCGGTVIVRRFNAAGVLQVPSGGAYANITAAATRISVEASSTDNQVTLALVVAGAVTLYSYNLTTGATLQTAIAALAGETVTEISMVRVAGDAIFLLASSDDANPEPSSIRGVQFAASTGTVSDRWRLPDAKLTSKGVFHGSELVFAFRYGATDPALATNLLVSVPTAGSGSKLAQLLAVKDLETACPPGVHLPEIVLDSSTSKYYWANATQNPDLDGVPTVTEMSLGSTARRQTATLGGRVYIAGGVSLVFDTRMLTESGFTERPRIVSLTGSNSTGELLSAGTYDYRVHQEQVDAFGDLHLSPPSAILSVTLGASDDTVTALVSTSHGLRRNSVAGGLGVAVRNVLSRTLATVSRTSAIVAGLTSIDPPSGALSGLTLILTAGGSSFTVTFSGAATTKTVILSEINTVVSSEITATAPDGSLILTSVDTGDGATVQVGAGTANTILGLATGDNDFGTTTRTTGENFQRAASAFNATDDIPGELVSIVDLRKDQSDPIVDSDLIRQQVLYSSGVASGAHHAPPPHEYVAAGRERIHYSGQPKRNRSTASKIIVPGEPAECAAEGFLAFQSQVSGDIEASAVLGDSVIHWTRNEIWEVSGSGPGRNGQGEFFAARRISKAGGIVADGWRSLCETDEGIFFQRTNDHLCFLGKSGTVEWKGKPVQEYLVLYPVITAATYLSIRHTVAFSCTNTAGTTGGILRYDIDNDAWFFDNVGACSALDQFQGRLVYIQAGVVYLEDASPGLGTFVPYLVRSGMFQGFQALGYGQVNEIGFLGTFRDDCVVTIKRSANGTTYPETLATFTLTTAGYAVGQRVTLLKSPNPAMQDSFALEYSVTSASADSEGVWLHAAALDTTHAPRFSRQGPAHKL
jgi:hypothetical protein